MYLFFLRDFLTITLLLTCRIFYASESTFDNIEEHKKKFFEEIASDPSKINNPSYPYDRVLKTVNANDTDCISKDPNAGKVFEQDGTKYQLMHNGVKVIEHGYYGSWMSDIIYGLRGHHEPQEEKAFYEVLKYIRPGSTMVELGAYWAYYSLWFSKAIPGAKNWLIEPEPTNIEMGRKNFALNGAEGFFNLGFVQLHAEDPLLFKHAQRVGIDTFMVENHIDHIHLLHSDIQGAEYEMLISAQEALSKCKIDYLFISTHSPGLHEACRQLLVKHDYLILCEHDMGESCSVDGLIVARRKDISGPTHINIRKYQ